jgi:hypothetical protein
MIKQCVRKKEMLRIGISYLISSPVKSHAALMAPWGQFANGKEALSSSWNSRSPFLPSYRTGWFAIVDVWDWSPLAVNEVSQWLGG